MEEFFSVLMIDESLINMLITSALIIRRNYNGMTFHYMSICMHATDFTNFRPLIYSQHVNQILSQRIKQTKQNRMVMVIGYHKSLA